MAVPRAREISKSKKGKEEQEQKTKRQTDRRTNNGQLVRGKY